MLQWCNSYTVGSARCARGDINTDHTTGRRDPIGSQGDHSSVRPSTAVAGTCSFIPRVMAELLRLGYRIATLTNAYSCNGCAGSCSTLQLCNSSLYRLPCTKRKYVHELHVTARVRTLHRYVLSVVVDRTVYAVCSLWCCESKPYSQT